MTNTAVYVMNSFQVNFEKKLSTINTLRHSSGCTAGKETAQTPLGRAKPFLIARQVSNSSNKNVRSVKLREKVTQFVIVKKLVP